MEANERELAARARRAYEWGRLRIALRVTWYVVPLVAVSLIACSVPARTIATGVLLFLIAVGMRWRGGVHGRAVMPGLVAGLGAFSAPLLATAVAGLPGVAPGSVLDIAYFAGGAITGCLIGVGAFRVEAEGTRFLVSAALVGGLTGSLGCVLGGLGGILGMALGLLAATAPVLVLVRVRA